MKTVGEIYKPGRIYRTASERFGTADLLCIKVPDQGDRSIRFVNLSHSQYTCYYFSSCVSDEVKQKWDSIEEYMEFKKKEKSNESHNI